MPFMFEKLEVYQKALDFADRISVLTQAFPSSKQSRRAAKNGIV